MKIELFPYQQEHVAIMMEHLEKRAFALDLSMLGTGKTYTTSQIALNLGVQHVIVVAPVSVLPKWQYMKSKYDVPILETLSFSSLRSVKNKQPKHGLLIREDYTETYKKNGKEHTVDKARFYPSRLYKHVVEEGVLLVIDEIQNIKNLTSQFDAAAAMIETILNSENSRVIMLSGSPIDKEEQALHMFRCLNILSTPELCSFNIGDYSYDYTGVEEIENYCRSLTNNDLPIASYYNNASCIKHVYQLFQKVFIPSCSHAMPPQKTGIKLSKFNGFYNIDEESREQLEIGVQKLKRACKYNPETDTISYGSSIASSFALITNALMCIEGAKIKTFVRLAKQELEGNSNKKLVICLNYTSSIDIIRDALSEYKPLLLQGCMSQKQRETSISKFQQQNNRYRLLIGNLTVCSTGIDLDDKQGVYPRTCLISPMFNTITLYQLGHRFQRMDTRSDSNIYMVYGKGYIESNILSAVMRKGEVMKQTTHEQAEAGVEFPGDYTSYYEE